MTSCPSGFKLTQFYGTDLPHEEMAQLNEHVIACEKCTATLAEMKEEIAPFLVGAEAHRERLIEAYEVAASQNGPRRFIRRAVISVGGLAAAAVAFVLVSTMGGPTPTGPGQSDVAVFRGSSTVTMEILARRGEQLFPVKSGDSLKENDWLRFWVTIEKPGYVSIISIEEDGDIFEFYPPVRATEDPAPVYLETAGRQRLPGSIVLDDAMGEESLILIYSEKEFDREVSHERVRKLLSERPADVGHSGDLQYHLVKIVKTAE